MLYSGTPHCSCCCACITWKLSAAYKWCFGKIQDSSDDFPKKKFNFWFSTIWRTLGDQVRSSKSKIIQAHFLRTFPYFSGCHLVTLARCTCCPWETLVWCGSFWRPGAPKRVVSLLSPGCPPRPSNLWCPASNGWCDFEKRRSETDPTEGLATLRRPNKKNWRGPSDLFQFSFGRILGGGFKYFYFHPYLGQIPNLG